MSDFGRGEDSTSGDLWRYVWLFVLGSLVLAAVLSPLDGTFVILLAIYLIGAALAGVVVLMRRRRS